MRVRAVWSEATQNVWRGRLATWMQAVVIGVGLASVFAAEWTSAAAAAQRNAELRNDGYHLLAVFGAGEGIRTAERVSRRECERLNHLSGVAAAGSLSELAPVAMRQSPDAVVHRSGATAGVYAVLDTVDPMWRDAIGSESVVVLDEILMSASHMDAIGLVPGVSTSIYPDPSVRAVRADTPTGEGRIVPSNESGDESYVLRTSARGRVQAVLSAPLEALGRGYRSAAVSLAPPIGVAEICIVALQGELLHGRTAPIAAVLADDALSYRRVLLGAERLQTGDDLYGERPWRHLWIVVAAVCTALRALVLWVRRSELALYRSLGARRSDVRLVAVAEFVLIVAWALMLALGVAAAATALVDAGPFIWTPALPSLLAATCAVLLGGFAAAAVVPTARPIDAMKDR